MPRRLGPLDLLSQSFVSSFYCELLQLLVLQLQGITSNQSPTFDADNRLPPFPFEVFHQFDGAPMSIPPHSKAEERLFQGFRGGVEVDRSISGEASHLSDHPEGPKGRVQTRVQVEVRKVANVFGGDHLLFPFQCKQCHIALCQRWRLWIASENVSQEGEEERR